jgi:hypothetical protein
MDLQDFISIIPAELTDKIKLESGQVTYAWFKTEYKARPNNLTMTTLPRVLPDLNPLTHRQRIDNNLRDHGWVPAAEQTAMDDAISEMREAFSVEEPDSQVTSTEPPTRLMDYPTIIEPVPSPAAREEAANLALVGDRAARINLIVRSQVLSDDYKVTLLLELVNEATDWTRQAISPQVNCVITEGPRPGPVGAVIGYTNMHGMMYHLDGSRIPPTPGVRVGLIVVKR